MEIERKDTSFVVSMGRNATLRQMDTMQHILDQAAESIESDAKKLAAVRCVSIACAHDMLYLRTRNRWTLELEIELIELHKAGKAPNMNEFGVTTKTQQAIMDECEKILSNKNADTTSV